jgi:hypothetical protein
MSNLREHLKRQLEDLAFTEECESQQSECENDKNLEDTKTNATQHTKIINYLVACISDFAQRHAMDVGSAYHFLAKHGGISFLIQHYEIEHTLSIDDAIDDLEIICR